MKRRIKTYAFIIISILIKIFTFLPNLFRKNTSTKNILIIQLYFIGDVIIITPAIEALKKKYSNYTIDAYIQKSSSDILKYNPHISNIYYDSTPHTKKNSFSKFFFKMASNIKVIKQLYFKNYDIIIDYSGYFDTSLITLLCGSKQRIGLSFEKSLSVFYNSLLINNFKNTNKIRNNYILALKQLDIPFNPSSINYKIYISKYEEESVQKIFAQFSGSKIVVMAPFAGWRSKEWPTDRFFKLSKMITDMYNYKVLWIGAKSDIQKAKKSNIVFNNQIISMMGKTTILESAALIKYANLFIGLDSSNCYIAESFNTTSIVIYGSTNAKHLQNDSNNNLYVIMKELDCSPQKGCLYCGNNTISYQCPNNFKCMTNISVQEVFNKVKDILL